MAPGRLLWIEFGKTKRSRRTLEVPALLRAYLLALAKGRAPDAQLISRSLSRRSGKKRDRFWLLYHVERLCTEAEVPVVCTQSLRGLHASVATEAGATSHVVASALGHSSPAVTHVHYIDSARHGSAHPDPAGGRHGRSGSRRPARGRGAPPAVPGAGTAAPRKPIRRASRKVAVDPALRVVPSAAASTVSTSGEPTGSPQVLGNG